MRTTHVVRESQHDQVLLLVNDSDSEENMEDLGDEGECYSSAQSQPARKRTIKRTDDVENKTPKNNTTTNQMNEEQNVVKKHEEIQNE